MARQHASGELTSLPSALLVAGTKSVVASLWKVHDTATALLMYYFYQIWEGGNGSEPHPSNALLEARKRLRSASRSEVAGILGAGVPLPTGDAPFAAPYFADAFECFGSW